MAPRCRLVCLGLASLLVTEARAQAAGSIEAGAGIVWHNKVKPLDALYGFGAAARIGIWLPGRFSVEGQADWTAPANSLRGNRFALFAYTGSLLYNIPTSGTGTIYLRGGYGIFKPSGACIDNNSIPCSAFGAASAALGFRVPIAGVLNVRGEVFGRTRSTYGYTGVGVTFGLSAVRPRKSTEAGIATSAPGADGPDEDGDGVPDKRDKCKGTPRGALVDVHGCPTDYDGDGVYDGIDRCPNTPRGTPVDAVGCPLKKPPERSR